RDDEVKALGLLDTTSPEIERLKIELRKMYALEIIAENLIIANMNLSIFNFMVIYCKTQR
ncbi:MAG: hypothetical protein KKH44_09430, partial [Bacteroidetes bacterium]|nr:hypothetical protein [Bacteroidota bacterium]